MKKILFTCYYYDFSRFLYQVYSEYKSQVEGSSAKFICFYPSASHYFSKIEDSSIEVFSTYNINRAVNVVSGDYDVNNDYYFSYESINDHSEKIKKMAAIEHSNFIVFWKEILKDVDVVISSGDTRPQTTIMLSIAKELGIKIFYFEQGPFNTTIFDRNGVNANVSFKPNFDYSDDSFHSIVSQVKPEKYFNELNLIDKIFSYIDWLYMYPTKLTYNYIPVYSRLDGALLKKIYHKIFKKKRFSSVVNVDVNYIDSKYILLPLQLPTDAQMICHSSLFDSVQNIVEEVKHALPKGYNLVIREHPLLINGYPKAMYDFVNKNDDIIIDSFTPLDEQIKKSEIVIVNNSTSGLDAIIRMKKVIVLGDAYYKYKEICFPVNNRDELKEVVEKAINASVPEENIKSFICNLYESYLFKGHFQDREIKNAKTISEYIINEIKNKK